MAGSSYDPSKKLVQIAEVNRLSWVDFVKLPGNVVEKAPYVASAVWNRRPFSSVEDLHINIKEFLDAMPSSEGKAALFRFLPDLSGRLAGRMRRLGASASSLKEQGMASMSDMTQQDADALDELNRRYHRKFGFPFILCAREHKAAAIVKSLRERLANGKDREIQLAINEIKKISWYRLQELVQNNLVAKL